MTLREEVLKNSGVLEEKVIVKNAPRVVKNAIKNINKVYDDDHTMEFYNQFCDYVRNGANNETKDEHDENVANILIALQKWTKNEEDKKALANIIYYNSNGKNVDWPKVSQEIEKRRAKRHEEIQQEIKQVKSDLRVAWSVAKQQIAQKFKNLFNFKK